MAQISCKNISINYGNNQVLDKICFNVYKGDYVCIVGENGSGKSTLLKGILGLLSLKSGEITLGDGVCKNEIGYLSQQTPAQQDFPASVWEVVLSGCIAKKGLRPFYSKNEKNTALNNIKKLKIENLKNKCYRELSGGQQQRVLLARALCSSEKILILDEPTTGLDPVVTKDFYTLVDELNKKNDLTIITTSHDINTAVSSATKILHLNNGIEFFGKTSDYLKSEAGKKMMGGHI